MQLYEIPSVEQGSQSLEQARIAEFQGILARAAVLPLTASVDIEQADPVAAAKDSFFRTDFQPVGEDGLSRPTFYALPEVTHELAEDLVGFEPFISRGGKASGHGVFFGALQFADGMELAVAVKPHFSNENDPESKRNAESSCLQDYFGNVAAKKCGFESLEPVGFILDEDGTPYSLTVLDQTLDTLDNINWTHFFEEGFDTIGMKDLLYKVAMITALLHNNGESFHGDLAARNIATNIYGQVFLIDWEYGNVTNSPAPDAEERFGKSWVDLRKLLQSMIRPANIKDPGVGMFEHCKESYWDNFKELFFDDYLEARKQLAQQGSHHMKKLRDTEAELQQLENSLHLEADKWQQIFALEKAATN